MRFLPAVYSGTAPSFPCPAEQTSPVFLCMNACSFVPCSFRTWQSSFFPVWAWCHSFISPPLLCSLSVSSVCRFVHVYLSNLFFSSRLFLSFSFFASCCRCRSQHWHCYSFCRWACRGPWGPPSGSPWLSQPRPCT